MISLLTGYCVEHKLATGFFHEKGIITNLFFYILTVAVHFAGTYVNEKFKQSFALIYLLIIVPRVCIGKISGWES